MNPLSTSVLKEERGEQPTLKVCLHFSKQLPSAHISQGWQRFMKSMFWEQAFVSEISLHASSCSSTSGLL